MTWRISWYSDEEAAGGESTEPADQAPALLLQAEAFDQADDRQHEDEQR